MRPSPCAYVMRLAPGIDRQRLHTMVSDGELISALSGIIGALLGGAIGWIAAVRVSRASRTMDMHREFNTERLSCARSSAFALLRRHWGMRFTDIADRADLDMDSIPLWEVMYFYQRLWWSIKLKQVTKSAVPKLFGEIFLWWYIVVYRQQLKGSKWAAEADIESLYIWLRKNIPPAMLSVWTDRCEADFDKLKKQHVAPSDLHPANQA